MKRIGVSYNSAFVDSLAFIVDQILKNHGKCLVYRLNFLKPENWSQGDCVKSAINVELPKSKWRNSV